MDDKGAARPEAQDVVYRHGRPGGGRAAGNAHAAKATA